MSGYAVPPAAIVTPGASDPTVPNIPVADDPPALRTASVRLNPSPGSITPSPSPAGAASVAVVTALTSDGPGRACTPQLRDLQCCAVPDGRRTTGRHSQTACGSSGCGVAAA